MEVVKYIGVISLFAVFVATENTDDYILCAMSVGSIAHIAEDGAPEQIPAESYHKCKSKTNYCYTLWFEDPNNGTVRIMGQGCWEQSGKPNECDRTECFADKKPPKAMNHTKFCCCSADKCNVNFTDTYVPALEDDETLATLNSAVPNAAAPLNPAIYAAIAAIFACFVAAIGAVLYLYWRRRKMEKKGDAERTGHHGNHYQSFPPAEYSLDKLKLLEVIGQGRYGCVWRGTFDDRDSIAVKVFPSHHRNYYTSERDAYAAAGEHPSILRFFGGCEFATNGGNGSAGPPDYLLLLGLERQCLQDYLRENILDLGTLAKMSLSIAKGLAHLHSDLGKSCIAHRDINSRNILVRHDFTCCICDLGLAVIPKKSENKSISEAGTLRYMAPEVLEGAVNLRDCETALKQIDVYALGLVLWELGTRCQDLQNAEPEPYQPPFAAEAGERPTLEQMQSLVSRRKARPAWPPAWKETAAVARQVAETAEDCWDQDAEARLTALCVVERLLELPILKGRSSLHPHHPPGSPTPLINNNHLRDRQLDDTSVNTIETMLSPSEENCKNSNQFAACVTPIQPYQGRNPCLERNLLSGSSDSLLIDKSSKHCSDADSQNLITSDFLNFRINRRATPIPYLQNAVHDTLKQPNANGAITKQSKSKFKWQHFRKLFNSRKQPIDGTICKHTQVKLNSKVANGFGQNGVTTSLLQEVEVRRPSTLSLKVADLEHDKITNSGISQIIKRKNSLSRQRSLEQFSEVFSSTSDLSRLKDPSQRIKTPGDVPPSVRRTRGKAAEDSARFSLYNDRLMCRGMWGSAPDLDPPGQIITTQICDVQDRDSVSSF